jgi:tetrahydromethanopterin:alpha-L-glutamate ligase
LYVSPNYDNQNSCIILFLPLNSIYGKAEVLEYTSRAEHIWAADPKCKSEMRNQKEKVNGLTVGVVITDPNDWTAAALLKNIQKRGAAAVPINLSSVNTSITSSQFTLFNGDLALSELDALIVRDVGISIALEQIAYKFDVLRHFETMNMPVMNSSVAIQNAANKFFSFYLFMHAHIPFPRTIVTSELAVALRTIEDFGSAVVKPIFGSQGRGIVKLENSQHDLESQLVALLSDRGVLYIQEFVPNPGRDIRVFVVGEEAVGAIYRFSRSGSFVSNLSQGGIPKNCTLTEEMRELATTATKAVGADFAGVDLIEGENGLLVLEVNATPSGRGIKLACGIDVTERIIDRCVRSMKGERF